MEGDTNLPAQSARTQANNNPYNTINNESPFPSTSSSVSSLSSRSSPPNFLRNIQAAYKRHRSLAPVHSSKLMPRRVMDPQVASKDSVSTSLPEANVNKPENVLLSRNLDKSFLTEKIPVIEQAHQEVASITPPIAGTMTNHIVQSGNQSNLTTSCKESGVAQAPLVQGFKKVHFSGETNSAPQGAHDRMATGMDTLCSHVDSLALTEMEWVTSNQAESSNAVNEPKNLTMQSVDMDAGIRGDGSSSTYGAGMSAWKDQLDRNFLQTDGNHPMTQSSACATSIFHNTSAPILSATTNCSSSKLDGAPRAAAKMSERSLPPQNLACSDAGFHSLPQRMPNNAVVSDQASGACPVISPRADIQQDNMQRDRVSSRDPSVVDNKSVRAERNEGVAQGQGPASKGASLDGKMDSSKAEKLDKPKSDKGAHGRKKNYDPEAFFKVNNKLYQRLGKIGSGGSSEVHKVISSDCSIYALKKIKLKGRDYATAYGFCQEILYLSKLKGKSNIIQLIDYEVTDKALLQEVMESSVVNKDGRVSEDGYIYMVLEYGEIDLAHMLSQKWKEMDKAGTSMDENWLRFYWQQILQAVETIHDERIVHSDLKPANFLLVKGSLKLIDFGIAKAIMSDTTNIQRDAQVGTLSYMSPEAFMCNESDKNGNIIKCGRPSDIWSLGCILYQMVYGRTPFSDYKTFWAKFKVITDPNHKIMYEPLSNPWLVDIMKRCLAWDRDMRWKIPQLLHHPFLVPLGPTIPLDKKCGILDAISESSGSNPDNTELLCRHVRQLLDAMPVSKDEQRKLLLAMLSD